MPVEWQYAVLNLRPNESGGWDAVFITDPGMPGIEPQQPGDPGTVYTDFVDTVRGELRLLNELGSQGWEMITQSADASAHGATKSFVTGWVFRFKRPKA